LSTYLVADGRHGAADRRYAKHGDGNDETDDLDKRHPVREERPGNDTTFHTINIY